MVRGSCSPAGWPHLPHLHGLPHPSWPRHTGSTHKGAGEAQKPPWWRRRHKATPTPHTHTHTHAHPHPRTHTNKPAPHRAGGITEKQSAVGSRAGKQQSPHRQAAGPSSPLRLHSQGLPGAPPPHALPSHSLLASSFFPAAGDEKKRGTEQGGVHPSAPFLMLGSLSPGRPQGRLLAGHSLIEVDVA